MPQTGEPLLALEQEWRAIRSERHELDDRLSLVYDRLPAWVRSGEDQHGRDWGWPDVGDLPEFKSACRAGLSTRPNLADVISFNMDTQMAGPEDLKKIAETAVQYGARVRAWAARQKEKADLERQAGIDDWDAKLEPFSERQDAIEEKIMNTPAHSVAGIAVKLRLVAFYTDSGNEGPEALDWDRRITFYALRDAEHMAGEARS